MSDKLIIDTLAEILKTKFNFQGIINSESINYDLASSYYKMDGIRLYQFLMLIEDKFKICFSPEEIVQNGFHTLAEIAEALERRQKN